MKKYFLLVLLLALATSSAWANTSTFTAIATATTTATATVPSNTYTSTATGTPGWWIHSATATATATATRTQTLTKTSTSTTTATQTATVTGTNTRTTTVTSTVTATFTFSNTPTTGPTLVSTLVIANITVKGLIEDNTGGKHKPVYFTQSGTFRDYAIMVTGTASMITFLDWAYISSSDSSVIWLEALPSGTTLTGWLYLKNGFIPLVPTNSSVLGKPKFGDNIVLRVLNGATATFGLTGEFYTH